jgi:magnesium-dependent phosphatase 1
LNIQLFVFDVDFTLWDAGGTWSDKLRPPFTREDEQVTDAAGHVIQLYRDVPHILNTITGDGVPMALASRTSVGPWVEELLGLLDVLHFFPYRELYPRDKRHHFLSLHEKTGIAFQEMVFFDDDPANIEAVRGGGVHTVHVPHGLTWDMIQPFREGASTGEE